MPGVVPVRKPMVRRRTPRIPTARGGCNAHRADTLTCALPSWRATRLLATPFSVAAHAGQRLRRARYVAAPRAVLPLLQVGTGVEPAAGGTARQKFQGQPRPRLAGQVEHAERQADGIGPWPRLALPER